MHCITDVIRQYALLKTTQLRHSSLQMTCHQQCDMSHRHIQENSVKGMSQKSTLHCW